MHGQARRIITPHQAPRVAGDVARVAFDTVAGLNHAASLTELDDILRPALNAIGFDNFVAVEVHGTVTRLIVGQPHKLWYPHTIANNYQFEDAPFVAARNGPHSLFYSQVYSRHDLTPLQKRIANERREFGLGEGYTNTMLAADGSIFAVAMIGEHADARNPDTAAAAHILSSYYGLAAKRLAAPPPPPKAETAIPTVTLTARQRDCLGWVREGKSATDIGGILGISAYTVHEHVAQACARLGVRTRVQAVAVALSLGLIDP